MSLDKNLEYKLVDPWIIEKLKKEKREEERPRIYIEPPESLPIKKDDEKPDRGVYKINIDGDGDPNTYDMIRF